MSNWLKSIILVAILSVLLAIYFIFDPSEHIWFPKCMLYMLTGLQCPACGSQRALSALLHGSIVEALNYNWFIIISLPYGGAIAMTMIFKSELMSKLERILLHRYVVATFLVIYIAWWIIRNIPVIVDKVHMAWCLINDII